MSSYLAESMLEAPASRTDRSNGKALVVLAFLTGFAGAVFVSSMPVYAKEAQEPSALWAAAPVRSSASAAQMPVMRPSNMRAGRLPQIPRAYSGPRLTVRADDVEAKVKKMIAENLSVDEAKLTSEASFIGDLGADSLDAVELLMALEEEFGVEIPEEEAQKLTTVQAVIDYAKANAK